MRADIKSALAGQPWRITPARKRQGGMLLIEALFAIVVFSLGVLALIGFQASAVRASAEARSRSDATLVVNQIIGDMWAADHTGAGLTAMVLSNLTTTWTTLAQTLPQGAVAVDITNAPIVIVTVTWQAPGDPLPHNLSMSTQITPPCAKTATSCL